VSGQLSFTALGLIIAVALGFDLINGMHDAANSIATVVSTRVLPPKVAVAWAAFFNFIAFLFFGLHVARTIGTGIVDPSVVDAYVVLAGLIGAISWNLVTWWLGFPSSSSHALIGGIAGAGIAKAGLVAIVLQGFGTAAIAMIVSPLMGFLIASILMIIVSWLVRRGAPHSVDRGFRRVQMFSAALNSLGHGGNDAQKTMGIIAVLLYSQGLLGAEFHVPFWVVLASQAAMGLGTLVGGWRIVRTLGSRVTDLKPYQGCCAEISSATTLFTATFFGIPVSTTHTVTGAIVGVGAMRRASAVRWGVASNIVWAWVCTIPAAGLIAFLLYLAFAKL
jgi:inorganic phosphate transporter, PiT family